MTSGQIGIYRDAPVDVRDLIIEDLEQIKQKDPGKHAPLTILSKEEIKDNLYSSYFVPVDLIIQNRKNFKGILLWDSVNARIIFANKLFPDFSGKDFLKALEEYQE